MTRHTGLIGGVRDFPRHWRNPRADGAGLACGSTPCPEFAVTAPAHADLIIRVTCRRCLRSLRLALAGALPRRHARAGRRTLIRLTRRGGGR